jgi:hypothetical protein
MDNNNLRLSVLTEEEKMFNYMVYIFAEEQIKSRSSEMDQ